MYFNETVEHHVTNWVNKNVKSNYKKAYELERVHLAIQQGEGEMLLKGNEEDEEDIFCQKSSQSNGKKYEAKASVTSCKLGQAITTC